MAFHRLDLIGKDIDSFLGLKDLAQSNFLLINLRSNELSNFEHFGTHPYLVELDLRDNKINSYLGLTKQRSLKVLYLEGNPIATHPFYRIMALMTVGYSIDKIDGIAVSQEEYAIARQADPHAALAVSYGWYFKPAKFSPQQYDEIIKEQKRIRRQTRTRVRTSVLEALQGVLAPKCITEDNRHNGEEGENSTPLQKSEVIARLTKRVVELEEQIQSSGQLALLQGGANDENVAVLDSSTKGLTASQLRHMTSLFSEGITVRDNVSSSAGGNGNEKRVCIEVSVESIQILDFMTRAKTLALRTKEVECQFSQPATLVLTDGFGASVQINFAKVQTLCTFYKLLYILQGKPVPLTPFMDSVDESLEGSKQGSAKEKTSSAAKQIAQVSSGKAQTKQSTRTNTEARTVSRASEDRVGVAPSASSRKSKASNAAGPGGSADRGSASIVSTPLDKDEGAAAIGKEEEEEEHDKLSNITDIPPLASPHKDQSIAFQQENTVNTAFKPEASQHKDTLSASTRTSERVKAESSAIKIPEPTSKNKSRFSEFLISSSSTEAGSVLHSVPVSTRERQTPPPSSRHSKKDASSKQASVKPTPRESAPTSVKNGSVSSRQAPQKPPTPAGYPGEQESISFQVNNTSVLPPLPTATKSAATGPKDIQESISFQVNDTTIGGTPAAPVANETSTANVSKVDFSRFKIIDSDSDSSAD